jgi:hypothetical protein
MGGEAIVVCADGVAVFDARLLDLRLPLGERRAKARLLARATATAPYKSGPSRDWIKVKNPECPATVRRMSLSLQELSKI